MNHTLGTFQVSSTRPGISGKKKSYKMKSMGSSRGKLQPSILLLFFCCDDMLCRCWEKFSISLRRITAAAEVPQESFTVWNLLIHTHTPARSQADTYTQMWARTHLQTWTQATLHLQTSRGHTYALDPAFLWRHVLLTLRHKRNTCRQ